MRGRIVTHQNRRETWRGVSAGDDRVHLARYPGADPSRDLGAKLGVGGMVGEEGRDLRLACSDADGLEHGGTDTAASVSRRDEDLRVDEGRPVDIEACHPDDLTVDLCDPMAALLVARRGPPERHGHVMRACRFERNDFPCRFDLERAQRVHQLDRR